MNQETESCETGVLWQAGRESHVCGGRLRRVALMLGLALTGACGVPQPVEAVDTAVLEPDPSAPWSGKPAADLTHVDLPPMRGIDVRGDCTVSDRFFEPSGPVVRVLSIDQATDAVKGFQGWSGGRGEVSYELGEPGILVLLSRGPTRWVVTERHPGTLLGVWVAGHPYGTTIEAPRGVPITERSASLDELGVLDWDAPEAREVEAMLAESGLSVTSFHSCERGSTWRLLEQPWENPVEP